MRALRYVPSAFPGPGSPAARSVITWLLRNHRDLSPPERTSVNGGSDRPALIGERRRHTMTIPTKPGRRIRLLVAAVALAVGGLVAA